MPKQKDTKEPTIKDVLSAINNLTEVLIAKEQKAPVVVVPEEPRAEVEVKGGFPVPYEYRELVDTLLNKDFGIDISYDGTTAAFDFAILVPKKYSNASQPHWDTYKEDRRSRMIQNAYGANGVREWVLKVYENFPQETQSAITYDRSAV